MRKRVTRVLMGRTFVKNAGAKPVSEISDRAKRYRANSPANRPPGPKQCGYCGARKNVGVDHVDGNEDNGASHNLLYACKSCNGKKAAVTKRAGLGKLTRQMNPARARAQNQRSLKAYGDAIKVMRGDFPGDVAAAVRTIHATPASVRSAYTSRSWPTRKAIYGPSGRGQGELPF
jgi:hypothetical protein